jgi:hypothetical protein
MVAYDATFEARQRQRGVFVLTVDSGCLQAPDPAVISVHLVSAHAPRIRPGMEAAEVVPAWTGGRPRDGDPESDRLLGTLRRVE